MNVKTHPQPRSASVRKGGAAQTARCGRATVNALRMVFAAMGFASVNLDMKDHRAPRCNTELAQIIVMGTASVDTMGPVNALPDGKVQAVASRLAPSIV